MKNKVLVTVTFLLVLLGVTTLTINKYNNGNEIEYNPIDLAVNPDDMEAYIGLVDYVFIGEITEYIGNFTDDSNYIPSSKYKVKLQTILRVN